MLTTSRRVPQAASPGKLAPRGRRPERAPPKAGIVQAARAQSIMQRYAEVAPSAAVSSSARRDRGSDDRMSMRSWSEVRCARAACMAG
jgi:transposase